MKNKYKRRKSKRNTGAIIGILGLILTIGSLLYAYFISPTKRDIENIKLFLGSYVRSKPDSLEILSSGIPPDLESRIDEMEKEVANVESSKIFSLSSDSYLILSEFYFNYFNLNKSIEYANKALNKNRLNIRAKLLVSIIEFYQTNYMTAIADAEDLKKQLGLGDTDTNKIIIAADLVQSMSYLLMGDPKRSIISLERLAPQLTKNKDYKAINIFYSYLLSKNYIDINDYVKGDYYYKQYLGLKKEILKDEKIDNISEFIMALTALEDDPSNAIYLVNNMLNGDKRNNLLIMLKNIFLAMMELKENKYEAAYDYLSKNIELSSSLGTNLMGSLSKYMLFIARIEKDKYIDEIALEAIKKGEYRLPFLDSEVYKAIAESYDERKDYNNAKEYYNKCLELYKNVGLLDEAVYINVDLYLLESNVKNYYSAYANVSSALKNISLIFKENEQFIIDESTDDRIKKKFAKLNEVEILLKKVKGDLENVFGFI